MSDTAQTVLPPTLKRISRKQFEKSFQSHLKSVFEENYPGKWSEAKDISLLLLRDDAVFSRGQTEYYPNQLNIYH